MNASTPFRIAVFPGDGIGHEITDVCLEVLSVLEKRTGGLSLDKQVLAGER